MKDILKCQSQVNAKTLHRWRLRSCACVETCVLIHVHAVVLLINKIDFDQLKKSEPVL